MIGQGQFQLSLAVDCSRATHHIVTADYERQLHLYSSDGNTLIRSFCGHGSNIDQTNRVNGMCFDDERMRILVCDFNNKRLTVWSSDGSQFITTINMPNNQNPLSVCVDYHQGSHRVIVGTYQSQILVFDASNNQVIQILGSQGQQPGQFANYIYGVCVASDGILLATDNHNHCVQIF